MAYNLPLSLDEEILPKEDLNYKPNGETVRVCRTPRTSLEGSGKSSEDGTGLQRRGRCYSVTDRVINRHYTL